jgi:PiT family inorganic phosphate transporter
MDPLLVVGVVIAGFVAYNVGGATTGPAFGPAVGAGVLSKTAAAGLMSVCFFAGAWTIGRRVVDTLGRDLLRDPTLFTLPVSIGILFFVGGALLIGNVSGAPASTSMTAVGSIAGFGLAAGQLDWRVVGEIVTWWVVSPVIGFWVSMMIGRYVYAIVARWVALHRSPGPLLALDRSGQVPSIATGPNTTTRELTGTAVVVAIGCLMAFSSGTSNVANAIAPLVGSGVLEMNSGILLGSAAVTVGAFTIARRTMETLGNDITELPLTAAIVVAMVSSTIVIVLSAIGVPASFVVIATVCIVGLGWGRATRSATVEELVLGTAAPSLRTGALATDQDEPRIGEKTGPSEPPEPTAIGDPQAGPTPETEELFDPATTARVVLMQNLVPVLATLASYLTFTVVPI